MPSGSNPNLTNTDTIYPKHLSRLHRRVVPKKRKGCSSRYRTQPVTFSEIKEVDEDNVSESTASCRTTSTQELQDLNEKFETFRRTSDLVFYSSKEEPDHIDSNTRNYSTNSKNSALSTSKSFDMIAQFQQTSFNDQFYKVWDMTFYTNMNNKSTDSTSQTNVN